MILQLLGWLGSLLLLLFGTGCLGMYFSHNLLLIREYVASGLYYVSEWVEEFPTQTKNIIKWTINVRIPLIYKYIKCIY